MAYMSQENKASELPRINAVLAKYGMKGSVGVRNHSTLVVNLKSGALDLIGNYNELEAQRNVAKPEHMRCQAKTSLDVNPHWYAEHFTGRPLAFLTDLFAALQDGNWDKSDIQTDYFNVGWYTDVHVGRWDKPYVVQS